MPRLSKIPEQVIIALDQLGNTLLGGYADETISSRSYRIQSKYQTWCIIRRIIDAVFFWEHNHCQQAYLNERKRVHTPPEYR